MTWTQGSSFLATAGLNDGTTLWFLISVARHHLSDRDVKEQRPVYHTKEKGHSSPLPQNDGLGGSDAVEVREVVGGGGILVGGGIGLTKDVGSDIRERGLC